MTSTNPSLAIVGATGAVGREFLTLLEERAFPHGELTLYSSARSAGTRVAYRGEKCVVQALTPDALEGFDLAFFSAGSPVSRKFARATVDAGTTVIDNSSAFRMDDDVPLIVPEVNGHVLDELDRPCIIANPNCSTIIALVAITPLHRAAGVERMVVSTYQAASGAGAAWMDELAQQARDYAAGNPLTQAVTKRPYLFNVFSHDTSIGANGYNVEEMKMVHETHKMWEDDSPRITATCVRVPVLRAHCESINLTFTNSLPEDQARRILASAPGVTVVDDRESNRFPEPIHASGCDDVLVGRIRADISQPPGKGLDVFVSGDQLRKGAALNAIQIAEQLMARTPARA